MWRKQAISLGTASHLREIAMTEFQIIFADPLTTAAYVYGSGICLLILFGWAALQLRLPATAWPPELRAASQRR
jgi:hypothetical protein